MAIDTPRPTVGLPLLLLFAAIALILVVAVQFMMMVVLQDLLRRFGGIEAGLMVTATVGGVLSMVTLALLAITGAKVLANQRHANAQLAAIRSKLATQDRDTF
jgi:uncharacterized membrane protein YjgN (DUF898 family)